MPGASDAAARSWSGFGSANGSAFIRKAVRATGRVVEANWAQIFTLREGLICKFREYSGTAAWEAGVAKR